MQNQAMRELTDRLRFLDDDIITPATAIETTATHWCRHLSPTNALQDTHKFKAPHLGSTLAAVPSTPPVPEVDSHCKGTTPIRFASHADASTQTNMEIPPIISQKSPEIPKKAQKIQKISRKFWHHLLWQYWGSYPIFTGSGSPF